MPKKRVSQLWYLELSSLAATQYVAFQDVNALCLAMLCVANFAAYERQVLKDANGGQKLGKYLPLEDPWLRV